MLKLEDVIPATGEWVLSTEPSHFIVTLVNDTEYLTQYPRIAIICRVGDKVGPSELPGKSAYEIKIGGLHELDSKNPHLPGPEIAFGPEAELWCQLVASRIGDSLNKWDEEVSMNQREEIWDMGQPETMLQKILRAITEK